jgi:hypothetical protein
MSINVTIQHRDGTQTLSTVWPSTEVALEDEFGVIWGEVFAAEFVPQKYLYFVAYTATHEAGKTPLDFKEWIKTIASVAVVDGDSPKDSDPAALLGSSES